MNPGGCGSTSSSFCSPRPAATEIRVMARTTRQTTRAMMSRVSFALSFLSLHSASYWLGVIEDHALSVGHSCMSLMVSQGCEHLRGRERGIGVFYGERGSAVPYSASVQASAVEPPQEEPIGNSTPELAAGASSGEETVIPEAMMLAERISASVFMVLPSLFPC